MSNFICSECGMTNIDCGCDGYKTPKEIELEKENKKLKEQLQEANECIKDKYLWTCSACSLVGSCMSCGNRYFGRYIKKWGVK